MTVLEYLKRQLLIGHFLGIPVKIDYRWFVVFILLSVITAQSVPKTLVESLPAKLALGVSTTLILFACIFLHELAHAIIARRENVEVLDIVLHPFGGLARFRRAPGTPKAEFRIAIAGPLASFALALLFLVLFIGSNYLGTVILSPLLFLISLLNLLLAVFNLFPGYPLDGGRVLRAFLWKRGYELNEATVLTGKAGQVIAMTLIVIGVFIVLFRGDLFTGLWTIIVGFFLLDSATGIIRQINDMEGVVVKEVMSPPISVSPDSMVSEFVDNIAPLYRQVAYPVVKDRQLYGILMLADIKETSRESWFKTKVVDAMRPITADHFVTSETMLSEARVLMRENGIGVLGVIDEGGQLVGFLQRNRIRKKQA